MSCKYYEPIIIEDEWVHTGETDNFGYPVGYKQEVLVGEFCTNKNTYDFNCDNCECNSHSKL